MFFVMLFQPFRIDIAEMSVNLTNNLGQRSTLDTLAVGCSSYEVYMFMWKNTPWLASSGAILFPLRCLKLPISIMGLNTRKKDVCCWDFYENKPLRESRKGFYSKHLCKPFSSNFTFIL